MEIIQFTSASYRQLKIIHNFKRRRFFKKKILVKVTSAYTLHDACWKVAMSVTYRKHFSPSDVNLVRKNSSRIMGTMSNICVEIICNVTSLWLALYILYSEKKKLGEIKQPMTWQSTNTLAQFLNLKFTSCTKWK